MLRHFGLLVPSTNTTCEIELGRLPGGLQLYTARLGKGAKSPFGASLDADVAYQSRMLADARVEVIALAQTSASLWAADYDEVTVKRMTEASGGVPSMTSAQAVGRALRALGVARMAMATPYSPEAIGNARRYFQDRYGVATVASESLGATDSYAIGKMDAGLVQAAFDRIVTADVEALLVPGGNFPTMDRIVAWEARYGRPVVTTNQATLWAIMRQMGVATGLPGMGRLLAKMPTG